MKSIDKFVLVLVASLALLLAGCGGGSSSTAPVDPGPTPQEMAISAAQDDLMTAQNAVAGATDKLAAQQAVAAAAQELIEVLMANGGTDQDLTDARSALKAANMAVAENKIRSAKDALTLAQAKLSEAATNPEMLAAYREVEEAADNLVKVLSANGGTGADIEAATVTREEAKGMVNDLTKKISNDDKRIRLAANAKSMAVAEAILGHMTASTDTPAEFSATAAGTLFDITRGAGDAKITLNQTTGATGQTTNAAKDKPYAASAAPSAGTGWMGMTYTYTDPKGKNPMESAAVYTNIDMAGDREYLDHFDGSGSGNPRALDADDTTGAIAIALATTGITVDNLSSSILPSAPTAPDATTTRNIDAGVAGTPASIDGMFYGIAGKYTCAVGADDCTLTRDDEDAITFSGGVLTFTPNVPTGQNFADDVAPDLMVRHVVPDADFLHFGYWMESTKQKDGSYKHVVRTFSGSEIAANTAVASLRGSATYSGSAAGRYVKKSNFDALGNPANVSDGTFVADADLTATFGNNDGTVAVADQFAISGEISNFMDGSTDLGWTLMLDETDLGTRDSGTGLVSSHTSAFNGMTTGSAGARQGSWTGTLYGADTTGPDNNAVNTDDFPTGVAGEFNGHFADGHVAGAFGADLDD